MSAPVAAAPLRLRWCSWCRRAAVPDTVNTEVVNFAGDVLREQRHDRCPCCDRDLGREPT